MRAGATVVTGALSVAGGLLGWELLARRVGPILLAGPLDVAKALVTERDALFEAITHTGLASLGALALACAAGVLAGVVGHQTRLGRAALAPWLVTLQVLPIVAIAPLLVVWLGYGERVAIATGALAAFYPMVAATRAGLAAPQQEWVDLVRLHGATPLQELRVLRLPAAMPSLLAGLRAAAGLSVIGAIVGEFVGSNGAPRTLGFLVVSGARAARTDMSFAAIVGAALLALSFHAALLQVERRVIRPWYGA